MKLPSKDEETPGEFEYYDEESASKSQMSQRPKALLNKPVPTLEEKAAAIANNQMSSAAIIDLNGAKISSAAIIDMEKSKHQLANLYIN